MLCDVADTLTGPFSYCSWVSWGVLVQLQQNLYRCAVWDCEYHVSRQSTLHWAELQSSSWGTKRALYFPKILFLTCITRMKLLLLSTLLPTPPPLIEPSCSSSGTLHWLLLQEPACSYRIITCAQSSHQPLRSGVRTRRGEPRCFKNKSILREVFSLKLLHSQ